MDKEVDKLTKVMKDITDIIGKQATSKSLFKANEYIKENFDNDEASSGEQRVVLVICKSFRENPIMKDTIKSIKDRLEAKVGKIA